MSEETREALAERFCAAFGWKVEPGHSTGNTWPYVRPVIPATLKTPATFPLEDVDRANDIELRCIPVASAPPSRHLAFAGRIASLLRPGDAAGALAWVAAVLRALPAPDTDLTRAVMRAAIVERRGR
jgi:hypothetical protein